MEEQRKPKLLSQEDAQRYTDLFNHICEQLEDPDVQPMMRAVLELRKQNLIDDWRSAMGRKIHAHYDAAKEMTPEQLWKQCKMELGPKAMTFGFSYGMLTSSVPQTFTHGTQPTKPHLTAQDFIFMRKMGIKL